MTTPAAVRSIRLPKALRILCDFAAKGLGAVTFDATKRTVSGALMSQLVEDSSAGTWVGTLEAQDGDVYSDLRKRSIGRSVPGQSAETGEPLLSGIWSGA